MQNLNQNDDTTQTDGQMWSQPASQRATVLVVDDEPRVLRSLQAALRAKFEVVTAQDADQAKRILEGGEDIDIIVSDERMPKCTGLELLSWCREQHPDCVRILLSSTDFAKKGDAILSADIYRCVAKPWDIQEFTEVLDRAAQTTGRDDRRASDERRGFKRERRLGFSRHRALAVVDLDNKYREAYKLVVGEIEALSEIYYFDSPGAVNFTLQHTANIGIVIIDLAIGDEAALNLIHELKQRDPNAMVILTSDPASISEFMPRVSEHKVHKFIAKPFSAKRIQPIVNEALQDHFARLRKH